ncbi:hypothetical protein FHL15_005313 [Xylaria flabelliformis]|uniref:Uncharacterized protein n=1 Tax=Xylaria flabelliformis TaxID=2512241 RepID=A0A553I166_9PEZI|nr:hypothetical protein FHL15_005313 [Xylaria flabelliformis]
MVEPSEDNPRSKRVEIWRNEVNTSSIYCVCSAPSRQAENSCSRGSFSNTLGKGAGSLVKGVGKLAKTLNQLLWEDDTFPSPSPEPGRERSSSSSLRRRTVCPVCPACGFPTDGVVYKQISNDGFGLVTTGGDSPESVSKARSLDEGEGKKKSLLKKVSQVFRRTKMLEPSRTPSELVDLSDLVYGMQGASITPKAVPHQGDSGKMTGTEMYHDIRAEATEDDGDGGLVTNISDDSRKKPEVGIAESAARLRRAQKLLHKGV